MCIRDSLHAQKPLTNYCISLQSEAIDKLLLTFTVINHWQIFASLQSYFSACSNNSPILCMTDHARLIIQWKTDHTGTFFFPISGSTYAHPHLHPSPKSNKIQKFSMLSISNNRLHFQFRYWSSFTHIQYQLSGQSESYCVCDALPSTERVCGLSVKWATSLGR